MQIRHCKAVPVANLNRKEKWLRPKISKLHNRQCSVIIGELVLETGGDRSFQKVVRTNIN